LLNVHMPSSAATPTHMTTAQTITRKRFIRITINASRA